MPIRRCRNSLAQPVFRPIRATRRCVYQKGRSDVLIRAPEFLCIRFRPIHALTGR